MVTCPVMDGVNGGHSHGDSPVPLKQYVSIQGSKKFLIFFSSAMIYYLRSLLVQKKTLLCVK